jgi:hypothetical protein
MNSEQKAEPITGREVFRFELLTVRAWRQLSAMHPGGARLSRGFAAANVAQRKVSDDENFMMTDRNDSKFLTE